MLFVERKNRTVRLQKYQSAFVVRCALGDSLALLIPVGIGPI